MPASDRLVRLNTGRSRTSLSRFPVGERGDGR